MNQRSIKLLAVAPYRFLPAINGGHKAVEQLYQHLGKFAETTVVSVQSNNDALAQNYNLVKLFSNGFIHYINPFYFFSIKQLISERNITHVIFEHPYMGWLGFLLKKYAGSKFILRSHNIEAMRFKSIGKWWWQMMWQYEKWVCQKADLVFFITDEDKDWAINHYQLKRQNCDVINYGIILQQPPLQEARTIAKRDLCKLYHLLPEHSILLFNGDLGYKPNELAVATIIFEINPLLSAYKNYSYTIIICGRNLDNKYVKQIQNSNGKIIYAGYVDDINQYVLAADVFINAVISGGGIKTKLVDALSYNCNAVSTTSGAIGIPAEKTSGKLKIVDDNNWQDFTNAIVQADTSLQISTDFYEHFYWGNIACKAMDALEKI